MDKHTSLSFDYTYVDRTRSSTGHSTMRTSVSMMSAGDDRGSSIVLMHMSEVPVQQQQLPTTHRPMETGERMSWWTRRGGASSSHLSTCGIVRVGFDSLLLVALAIGFFFASYYTKNRALPFIFVVLAAFTTFEYTWLAYRVRLRIYLPFKLHQKQTCRDIYGQIMNYSVDLQTCVVTPWAERFCRGYKRMVAAAIALVVSGAAFAIAWFCVPQEQDRHLVIAYTTLSVFLGVFCSGLSPNLRDAVVLLFRYAYYVVCTADLLLSARLSAESSAALEPFSLLLLSASLILIGRAVTSKDPMESVVMVLLDFAGLVYLACLGNVISYLSVLSGVSMDPDGQQVSPLHRSVVFALFFIIWSAEVGSFLMEKLLHWIQFPWAHPLAPRLSSSQNLEKLVGALIFGVGASLIVSYAIAPAKHYDDGEESGVLPVPSYLLVIASVIATVCGHIAKLWLVSLKKVARVEATSKYLRVGDGVLDRVDSLLLMTIFFAVFVRQALIVRAPNVA
ncbi:hypothetical protein Poli38472_001304 [Pythium oligandrum]|uniref:Phosphatidate cytidylyltransferase n=1 Tax=Pythium oligandrum TaxID=41045 RepID=A0A8K1FT24_PYTOL|nr:hypothetical protein Poli38472_001304 [Pythium oligandrum]|eukprot:TMW69148.1 hypothetical protein Poli38472_001304 [Pythium oligandrum]